MDQWENPGLVLCDRTDWPEREKRINIRAGSGGKESPGIQAEKPPFCFKFAQDGDDFEFSLIFFLDGLGWTGSFILQC